MYAIIFQTKKKENNNYNKIKENKNEIPDYGIGNLSNLTKTSQKTRKNYVEWIKYNEG